MKEFLPYLDLRTVIIKYVKSNNLLIVMNTKVANQVSTELFTFFLLNYENKQTV